MRVRGEHLGNKFDFSILGDLKGYGDKANMDSLCELLCHLAPDEVVDDYFKLRRRRLRRRALLLQAPTLALRGPAIGVDSAE